MTPDALHLLGLGADADERAIKRAYVALLKTTRPDEDPEGFQRLNEAYREALAACAARDAVQGPLSPVPLPLPPERWSAEQSAPGTFPTNDHGTLAAFDMDTFFRELHARAGREPVAAFRAWLLGHEALYAMALKDAITVPLVHALDGMPPMRREHLDETLRFFGLDTVNARTQWLEVVLHRMRGNALRPDRTRMGRGSLLVWSLLIGLYAIICIAHFVKSS